VAKPTKELRSLDEFNAEKKAFYDAIEKYPKQNGIACPKCSNELCDHSDILMTTPPQRRVFCAYCGFKGYRLL
jgi:DNA-directed RNA polymerase subunit RPC12/RpoP